MEERAAGVGAGEDVDGDVGFFVGPALGRRDVGQLFVAAEGEQVRLRLAERRLEDCIGAALQRRAVDGEQQRLCRDAAGNGDRLTRLDGSRVVDEDLCPTVIERTRHRTLPPCLPEPAHEDDAGEQRGNAQHADGVDGPRRRAKGAEMVEQHAAAELAGDESGEKEADADLRREERRQPAGRAWRRAR